ncbi:MAG: 3-hydroxyacyl-CoA dehydrogenase family protein [Acidocella sp.]|nr:3-hydroxyacyl-CoA dehydrogenase family protein [Acidocella sp.]
MSALQRIAVLGAGLMGHGIAQVFAAAGHEVGVYDPSEPSIQSLRLRIRDNLKTLECPSGAEARVHGTTSLAAAVAGADVVIEAALEDLAVKQRLFAEVEALVPVQTILASNTSVIPITAIMAKLTHRARSIGAHWWNPPFLIPLVEVIGTVDTSAATIETMMALLKAAGKTPVHVKKDVPGFIGNRMQHALWREAIALVAQGICTAEDVDTVVKASFGRRLGVLGPLENVDLVGTDLTLAIHRNVLPAIDSTPDASPALASMVEAGRFGMKSNQGFYNWTEPQKANLRARVFAELKRAAAADDH